MNELLTICLLLATSFNVLENTKQYPSASKTRYWSILYIPQADSGKAQIKKTCRLVVKTMFSFELKGLKFV